MLQILATEACEDVTEYSGRGHFLVTYRLDYCNSILSGCSKKSIKTLQVVQKAAAHILTGTSKRDHICPVLASL